MCATVADFTRERFCPDFLLCDLLQRRALTNDVASVAQHGSRSAASTRSADAEGGDGRAGQERGASAGPSRFLLSETKHRFSLDRLPAAHSAGLDGDPLPLRSEICEPPGNCV